MENEAECPNCRTAITVTFDGPIDLLTWIGTAVITSPGPVIDEMTVTTGRRPKVDFIAVRHGRPGGRPCARGAKASWSG